MKFLFADASHDGWGTEQHLVSLALGLLESGHEVAAIVQQGSPTERWLESTGITVIPVRFRTGVDVRFLAAILPQISQQRPDWIIANQSKLYWPLALLGKVTGVRIALFRHLVRIKQRHTRVLLPKLVGRFYVASDFARNELVCNGGSPSHIIRLYNPIDTQRFRANPSARATLRARLGVTDHNVLAGFVGRIEPAKGVSTLREAVFNAMDVLPHLKMVWVGDGVAKEETMQLAAARGYMHRHSFVGWSAAPEEYYAGFDMLITPSIEAETFGRVVAEAQSCDVPVIASNIGGLPEAMVSDTTGVLVPPGDAVRLAQAIVRLSTDDALRHRFASAGRQFVVDNFSTRVVCKDFIDSLLKVMGSAAPAHKV